MKWPSPSLAAQNAAAPALALLLVQAKKAHQAGDLASAEWLYRRVLNSQAEHPDAQHFLGVLLHQRGQSELAIAMIQAALRVVPHYADAHNNLGNVFKETGQLAAAEAAYRRALDQAPRHYNALGNLAMVLEAQQRPQEALAAYSQLLREAPVLPNGQHHYRMGVFLRRHAESHAHMEQAIACFRLAIRSGKAAHASAYKQLGVTLYVLDRKAEAEAVYREWLEREPGNPIPRHMLASCGAGEVPARAADDYVREVFDHFAEDFDEQLLHNLDYRAPQVLTDAIKAVLPPPAAALDVLDAGCGTGLCGPFIRAHARTLVGVDLSPGMLDKARARGGYDTLELAELGSFLAAHPAAYDLVIAADTLNYFGAVAPVFVAADAALRPGGWLAFTLEVLEQDGARMELSPSGRYRHSRAYLQNALSAGGFGEAQISRAILRKEIGQPVQGWLVLAQKGDR